MQFGLEARRLEILNGISTVEAMGVGSNTRAVVELCDLWPLSSNSTDDVAYWVGEE